MMRIRPWRRTTPRLAAATALVALGLVGATGTPPAAAGGQPADNTCAIRSDGVVKCWGTSSLGQLGQGDTTKRGDGPGEMGDNLPPIDLGTGRTATAIAANNPSTDGAHNCAILDTGQVKCWGNNNGQLGLGDGNNRGDGPGEMGDNLPPIDLGTGRTATAIVTGPYHTCALLDNDQVKCWGVGVVGLLGQGDTTNRGDDTGEMGDNLPPIDLGTGRTATAIAAGIFHTCALLDNDQVKCWGRGDTGRLGQGNTNDRGDGPGEMGDNLPPIDLGTGRTATAITAGSAHTCALLDNGQVKCWGAGFVGVLGQGDSSDRGDGPGEMGDNLPPIDLGTGRTATAITAGGAHTCALLDNDQVKCWGYNLSGQLGLGDTTNRGDGAGEMGDNLPPIDLGTGRTATAIFARPRTTCAHLDDGTLKCWGDGSLGQLGQGDTTNRGDGPGEMGDNLPPIDLGTVTPVGDPVCQGQTVTVDLAHGDQPTPGDDVILGTPGDDTIQARRGDDLVCGLGGVDTIGGGGGTDRIFGGGGNDILRSGPSGGLIAGGAGNDTITGAAGKDTLRGGPDDDTITGAAGNDLGDGGPGTDTCTLAPGNDTTRNCEA